MLDQCALSENSLFHCTSTSDEVILACIRR